jgi:hypothetical protein
MTTLWYQVAHLDSERLLAEWRWLCPSPMTIIARTAFADLYLRDQAGRIHRLDVAIGKLNLVAGSEAEFFELANTPGKREAWFAESAELAANTRGLRPDANQCIAFSIPLVFAESGYSENPYVGDIYEHVSFLGDLHQQIANLPDGAKVRLRTKP